MQFAPDEHFCGKEGAAGSALMAAKTAAEATDAGLAYEWQAATGTYAWRKEHAWRLDKIAQILIRTDASKHFPPADAAGYACRALAGRR